MLTFKAKYLPSNVAYNNTCLHPATALMQKHNKAIMLSAAGLI